MKKKCVCSARNSGTVSGYASVHEPTYRRADTGAGGEGAASDTSPQGVAIEISTVSATGTRDGAGRG
jgi:hypothetical protein